MHFPNKATIIEVGPRDGLQNEPNIVPTEKKIAFIQSLKNAGLREMELTSFVSPKWVPQMKDAKEVIAQVPFDENHYVLTPNKKGIERLYQTNIRRAAVFVGVSSTFNQKNINKTTKESLAEWQPLVKELKKKGYFVRACISTAFHCHYEGKIPPEKTVDLCRHFVEMGVDELSVADTTGRAVPKNVLSLFQTLNERFGEKVWLTAHFHNTYGMALANVFAALEAGISRFDASAGGLGGCPFSPGASGNVATEDVVFMLEEMGISTNVDLQKLKSAVEIVAPYMSRTLDSKQYHLLSSAT